MGILLVYKSVKHMHKMPLDLLKLELQMVLSHHMGAGT